MATRAPYKIEIESEFNRLAAEEAGHQSLTEYYKALLTGAQQTAETTAQTQYQTTAQTAAQQASYDISGAYANYLKQQRNIAAQGRLESGYKEEVSDILQQQYQTAYSQARATQAETLTKAKKTAQDLYSDIYSGLSKSAQTQIEAIEKQSKIKANLANAMIEQAQLSGDPTYEWFAVDDEGKTILSDWGYDQMSKYLMASESDFVQYLQDKGLDDELAYYLSDSSGVRKEFFGITETGYDPMSEESLGRRLGTTTITDTGEIISYVDTIEKPTYKDMGSYGADQKYIKEELTNYAKMLGLTEADVKSALGGKSINDTVNAFGLNVNKYDDKTNDLSEKLLRASKKKYIKE